MILENYRDRKLKELYQVITRSDFMGNLEDDYMLSVMYAMRCIDRIQENDPFIKENDYVNVAKEIIRIYDSVQGNDYEDLSIEVWTRALMTYMRKEDKKYRDIHRSSSFDLMKDVIPYIKES